MLKEFVVNGRQLSCAEWGNANAAQTVICVHGLTRNGRDFDFLAQTLAKQYHVLCPDMVGRGQSEWLADPSGYTNPAYIADVVAMLTQLGISRVHWIGTSMGGIMGMMVCAMQPGLIETLVLNDIGAMIPASGLSRIRDIVDFPTRFSSQSEAEAMLKKRCESFGITEEVHWLHLMKHGIKEVNTQFVFTYDPTIFSMGFSKDTPLADIDLWPLWDAVKSIPTLLIRGKNSDLLTHETALEMRNRHSNLQLKEIANTGHAPALMDDAQISIIIDWIAKQRSPA
jgi:pimeloyl-ACP methyl ester carboxylesterase